MARWTLRTDEPYSMAYTRKKRLETIVRADKTESLGDGGRGRRREVFVADVVAPVGRSIICNWRGASQNSSNSRLHWSNITERPPSVVVRY